MFFFFLHIRGDRNGYVCVLDGVLEYVESGAGDLFYYLSWLGGS